MNPLFLSPAEIAFCYLLGTVAVVCLFLSCVDYELQIHRGETPEEWMARLRRFAFGPLLSKETLARMDQMIEEERLRREQQT